MSAIAEEDGVTWNGEPVTWDEVRHVILLAECGQCWPGSEKECVITVRRMQLGDTYTELKGTGEYVHQARIERAKVKGLIPGSNGITLGERALHPLKCGHWQEGKTTVEVGTRIACGQCGHSREVLSRLRVLAALQGKARPVR